MHSLYCALVPGSYLTLVVQPDLIDRPRQPAFQLKDDINWSIVDCYTINMFTNQDSSGSTLCFAVTPLLLISNFKTNFSQTVRLSASLRLQISLSSQVVVVGSLRVKFYSIVLCGVPNVSTVVAQFFCWIGLLLRFRDVLLKCCSVYRVLSGLWVRLVGRQLWWRSFQWSKRHIFLGYRNILFTIDYTFVLSSGSNYMA